VSVLPHESAAPSIISADMRVAGDLRTSGDVQVDGTIDGDIQSTSVTVGKSAEINGEVVADRIVVWGRVNGRIRCKDVTLEETAAVNGDILHESIQIARGAHVEGTLKRGTDIPGSGTGDRAAVNLVVSDAEGATGGKKGEAKG